MTYLSKIVGALRIGLVETAFPVSLRPSVRKLDRGGGQNLPPPPSGARSAEYPSGARVKTAEYVSQSFHFHDLIFGQFFNKPI